MQKLSGGSLTPMPEYAVLGLIDGAFAEYVAIPATNVFRPNVYIPSDLLSIFDPFGNAVHTALSFNMVGEDVIIGAGPIGIMAAMVAGHCGARNVILTDVNEYRLDLAKPSSPKFSLSMWLSSRSREASWRV